MIRFVTFFSILLFVGYFIFIRVNNIWKASVDTGKPLEYGENFQTQNESESKVTESVELEAEYSAWIPWWNDKTALVSLEKAKNKLSTISPVWYKLNEQSEIEEIQSSNKQNILNVATASGLAIIPTVANDFDSERTSIFLRNEDLVVSGTDKLIETALSNGYQGWDLDWEEVSEDDKESFTKYVSYLAQRLHEKDLKLSVTVHAQTGKLTDWEGSRGQDWPGLSRQADYIRIMAYDFHNSETEPGPITPPEILGDVLKFAISVIPKKKIVLGLPTYGYDWGENSVNSYQYVDILNLIEEYDGFYEYDPELMALKGNYIANEVEHTLWFEDRKSIVEKISMARSFGIYKFAFWSLGGEDSRIWESEI